MSEPDSDDSHLLEMAATLCKAPDSFLDASTFPRLRELSNKTKEERRIIILSIIDDCVYAALSGSRAIIVLRLMYEWCGGDDFSMDKDRSDQRYDSIAKRNGEYAP